MAISGHKTPVVSGNDFVSASFGGKLSSSCLPGTPAVQGLVVSNSTTLSPTLQSDFVYSTPGFQLAICYAPSSATQTGYSHTA